MAIRFFILSFLTAYWLDDKSYVGNWITPLALVDVGAAAAAKWPTWKSIQLVSFNPLSYFSGSTQKSRIEREIWTDEINVEKFKPTNPSTKCRATQLKNKTSQAAQHQETSSTTTNSFLRSCFCFIEASRWWFFPHTLSFFSKPLCKNRHASTCWPPDKEVFPQTPPVCWRTVFFARPYTD